MQHTDSELPSKQCMESDLRTLREEMENGKIEAGEANIYTVAILHTAMANDREHPHVVVYVIAPLLLAASVVVAIMSLMLSASGPKCVLDEDCKPGTVCVFPILEGETEPLPQSLCIDCALVLGIPGDPWMTLIADMIGPKSSGFVFTNSHLADRYPAVSRPDHYCKNALWDHGTQSWFGVWNDTDTSRTSEPQPVCLYVRERLVAFGMVDCFVLFMAFCILCSSIATDRVQQLHNKVVLSAVMPPIISWSEAGKLSLSAKAASLKLVEIVLDGLLPLVPPCMIMLLMNSSLGAIDILLNGVAISFLLLIDDELPWLIIPRARQLDIDMFVVKQVSTKKITRTVRRKSALHVASAFIGLNVNFYLCTHLQCRDLLYVNMGWYGLLLLTLPVAEELVGYDWEQVGKGMRDEPGGTRLTDVAVHFLRVALEGLVTFLIMWGLLQMVALLHVHHSPGMPESHAKLPPVGVRDQIGA